MTEALSRRRFLRRVSVAGGVAAGTSAAGCLGIVTGDRARYYSTSAITVESFDYDTAKAAAEATEDRVEGPYYGTLKEPTVGFHPARIHELNERFGDDYRVDHLVFYYSSTTRLRASFAEDADTEVALWDDRAWAGPDPFLPEYLPEEGWLVERLTLLFDVETDQARTYVDRFMDVITEGQTDVPSIDIAEAVTFDAVYDHLVRESTATEGAHSGGEGWHLVTYLHDGVSIAEVGYRLQSTKVIRDRGNVTYTVQFDPLGAVSLEVTLPAGETIPDQKRRSTFREMFDALGFPPSLVDNVEFEYIGSMW